MAYAAFLASILVLLLFSSSCTPRRAPIPGNPLADDARLTLQETLIRRDQEIRSLRSLSQVVLTESEQTSAVRGIIVFQKPDNVVLVHSDEREGQFEFRPLEPGYGITVGNSLRRILLSSLEGFAIASIKIE